MSTVSPAGSSDVSIRPAGSCAGSTADRWCPGSGRGQAPGTPAAGPGRPGPWPARPAAGRVAARARGPPAPRRRRAGRIPGPDHPDRVRGGCGDQDQRADAVDQEIGEPEIRPSGLQDDDVRGDRHGDPDEPRHRPARVSTGRPPVPGDEGDDGRCQADAEERTRPCRRCCPAGRSCRPGADWPGRRRRSRSCAGFQKSICTSVVADVPGVAPGDHRAVEAGSQPPVRPGQGQMSEGCLVEAPGQLADRERKRIMQPRQRGQKPGIADDREQQADPLRRMALPGDQADTQDKPAGPASE